MIKYVLETESYASAASGFSVGTEKFLSGSLSAESLAGLSFPRSPFKPQHHPGDATKVHPFFLMAGWMCNVAHTWHAIRPNRHPG